MQPVENFRTAVLYDLYVLRITGIERGNTFPFIIFMMLFLGL
jgi:hypothetical protein